MRHSYTESDLREAVKTSTSIRQVLQKLNIVPAGGNYETTKRRIVKFGIDTDHFTGQGHLRGKTHSYNKIPLSEILVPDKLYSSHKLKNRLIKEGLKKHRCESCGIVEWNGKPAPIELDHIDGNRYNNTIENLRILCPNCHAQTDTYRGRNKS
jgi:hypothetical protein